MYLKKKLLSVLEDERDLGLNSEEKDLNYYSVQVVGYSHLLKYVHPACPPMCLKVPSVIITLSVMGSLVFSLQRCHL